MPDDPNEFRNWSLPDDPSLRVLSLKRLQSLENVSVNCENHCIRIGALENLVSEHSSIRRISLGLAFDLDADKVVGIANTLLKFVKVDLTNGSFLGQEQGQEQDETAEVEWELLLASTREDSKLKILTVITLKNQTLALRLAFKLLQTMNQDTKSN